MTDYLPRLKQWISEIAEIISEGSELEPNYFISFLQDSALPLQMIDIIEALDDADESPYYSACVFALDICIVQLHSAEETGHKRAGRELNDLMNHLAKAINKKVHSLHFWLPILNAFYDLHIELSTSLRLAYLELAGQIDADDEIIDEPERQLETIRDMILELSDLSVFDMADNFFAQSYAMPYDFFSELLIDLYQIEEGKEVGLLMLLHPHSEVRNALVLAFDEIHTNIMLSSSGLSRLQTIKNWYPPSYHSTFNRWIKCQRIKRVVFATPNPMVICQIKATEIDGSGAQGVFIHVKRGRVNQICGLLFKYGQGIKNVWVTREMTSKDIVDYYQEAFDDSVTLRVVDLDYLLAITGHFLFLTLEKGEIPGLHLLEIQELLGISFTPKLLDIPYLIEHMGVEISPFTAEALALSFKRSKAWLYNKPFTESWFIENTHIDKLVNRCSSIVNGAKVCAIDDAMDVVFAEEMETQRDRWLFHFLWMALWTKSHARKNEKIWQDNFLIAHAIYSGISLSSIPVMQEISKQTVINSIETMHERRAHLHQE